jgi:hypothetical protein
MTMLDDGTYDALIIDAEAIDDTGDERDSTLTLDLTIVAGEHKGEVVSLRASGLGRPALDLLGLPVTLTVADGRPVVVVDPV